MNVLVIGGAGFIGSHLCERLRNTKDIKNIYSLDNYFTGSKNNHIEGVEYFKGDSRNIYKLIDLSIDLIYHLGEYSRVEASFDDEELVFTNNLLGSREVFKFAFDRKIKIVYAGSSTKYSKDESGYIESPYAFYKRYNTELLKNMANWYNGNYAITYFYNVYGDREIATGKYATVIAKFLKLIKNKKKIPVTLPGSQVRNFTHVSDIVDGLLLVGFKGFGDGYNIGNKSGYSILDIVKILKADYYFVPEKKGNRFSSEINTRKIEELGWECKEKLEVYLNEKNKN